jgi:hypothetical protein
VYDTAIGAKNLFNRVSSWLFPKAIDPRLAFVAEGAVVDGTELDLPNNTNQNTERQNSNGENAEKNTAKKQEPEEADDIIDLKDATMPNPRPANEDSMDKSAMESPKATNVEDPGIKFIDKKDKFSHLLSAFLKITNKLNEIEKEITPILKEYSKNTKQLARIVKGLFEEAQEFRTNNQGKQLDLADTSTPENIESRKQKILENQKFMYSAVPSYVDVDRLFTLSTLKDKLVDRYSLKTNAKDKLGRDVYIIDETTDITVRADNQLTFTKDGKKLRFEHRRDGQVTVYQAGEDGIFTKTGTLWMYDAEKIAKRFIEGKDLGIKGKVTPATTYKIPDPKIFERDLQYFKLKEQEPKAA